MARKSTSNAKTTPAPETVVKDGKPRRVHRVPEVVPAPVPERTIELEGLTSDEANAESGEDALMGSDALSEELAEEASEKAAGPVSGPVEVAPDGAKYAWLKRVNAQRALDHAVAQISKHDFSQWPEVGVNGVAGALAVLKAASAKMATLNKKSKPSRAAGVEAGSVVQIREKAFKKYDGIIDEADRKGLKVLINNGKQVRAVALSGEKFMLALADVELGS